MPTTAAAVAGWGVKRWPHVLPGPMVPGSVPASIRAIEQNVWPPRILVAATGLNPGHVVTIWRSVLGVRTALRGAQDVTTTDVSLVAVDAEQPFDVLLSYVLTVDGVDVATTTITSTLDGGKVALSDAITGEAAEVVITAWPSMQRSRQASTYQVGGRNIVVAGQRGGFTSTIEVFTETTTAAENLIGLLDTATAGTIQIRQPGGYDRVDSYVAVTADAENRWSQDGSDERRTWSLDVVEVAAWSSALEARAFTYDDVAASYVGLTYADLAGDYPSYLDLALGDFS